MRIDGTFVSHIYERIKTNNELNFSMIFQPQLFQAMSAKSNIEANKSTRSRSRANLRVTASCESNSDKR
jgi:hypothetical protein